MGESGRTAQRVQAVVIGAGPAGATAAALLAQAGAQVWLVDRASFPRAKVCGSCLSGSAVAALRELGLASVLRGAMPTTSFTLCSRGRRLHLPLDDSLCLSRSSLDAALVDEAIRRGCRFLPRTSARVGDVEPDARQVHLADPTGNRVISASIVLAADGLGGTALSGHAELSPGAARGSRMGLGAALPAGDGLDIASGRIVMACAGGGYVGLVRDERGLLNLAAAVDPNLLRTAPSPQDLVQRLLDEAGLSLRLPDVSWRGTPELTRRRTVWAERVLVLGDAAGYVEPFTGEGIGWAIRSAIVVVPTALQALQRWTPDLGRRWSAAYARELLWAQRRCRLLTWLLRSEHLRHATMAALAWRPSWAQSAAHLLHGGGQATYRMET
jgi:flavin-dependent dehydrogenase